MSTARMLPPVAELPDDLGPRLCSLLAQTLEPLGFTPKSNYRLYYYWTRETETLRQRCGVEFNDDRAWPWYDCRLLISPSFETWAPFADWTPDEAAAARRILDRFQRASADFAYCRAFPNRDAGFGCLDRNALNRNYLPGVKDAYTTFQRILEKHVVPLFERRREALDVLNAYDDGTLAALETYPENPSDRPRAPSDGDSELYFGSDQILNALNLSSLRLQNGQNAEALALFEETAVLPAPYFGTFETRLDSSAPYRRAAREVALLGVDVAKRRIETDGPGAPATRRPFVADLTQTPTTRSFKRPSFASPGLDEPEVERLLWLARFSDDETQAAEATRRLEELANQASIVVYEGGERRVVPNATFADINDAASPTPPSVPALLPPSPRPEPDPENADAAFATYKSDARRRLEEVFAQRLEPLGFKKGSRSPRWTRKGKTLSQYCRFLAWDRRDFLVVSFGYTVIPCFACWDAAPQNDETKELIARFRKKKPRFEVAWKPETTIFDLSSDSFGAFHDWNHFSKDGELEPLIATIDTFLRAEILPFFARFRETDDLLREYEAGRLEQKIALGYEAGPGREFVAAQTYFRAGNYDESLARFEAVPERFRNFRAPGAPVSQNDEFLLEIARLGALSVRKILETQEGDVVSHNKRRQVTPIPEPLASALPHYRSIDKAREVYWARELANSAFAPEAEMATRDLKTAAETLRTLQEKSAQVLEPLCFTRESPISWTRETATLRQRFRLEIRKVNREFCFFAEYYQKPDFSPWDAASQDAETQATLARLKTLVENDFANKFFARSPRYCDYSKLSSSKELLTAAETMFTETILPYFARWRETPDVLNDPELGDVKTRFEPVFGAWNSVQGKFGYALALFQAGRYTESAKRFDALSKIKKNPNPEIYDDATWSTLQDAARLAVVNIRKLVRFGQTRKKK